MMTMRIWYIPFRNAFSNNLFSFLESKAFVNQENILIRSQSIVKLIIHHFRLRSLCVQTNTVVSHSCVISRLSVLLTAPTVIVPDSQPYQVVSHFYHPTEAFILCGIGTYCQRKLKSESSFTRFSLFWKISHGKWQLLSFARYVGSQVYPAISAARGNCVSVT